MIKSLEVVLAKTVPDKLCEQIFCFCGILLFLLWFGGMVDSYNGDQESLFFRKTDDYFADFYNNNAYPAKGDPYVFGDVKARDGAICYPPLAYVVHYVFGRLGDFKNLGAKAGWETKIGTLSANLMMLYFVCLLFFYLFGLLENKPLYKNLIIASLLLSGLFIGSYERGNIAVLVAFFTSFFFMNFDSDNKTRKEFALLSLAFAFGLKLSPIVFGLLLVNRRMWKESIRLFVYASLFFFLPFLFFKGGLMNISFLLQNVALTNKSFSPMFNIRKIVDIFSDPNLRSTVDVALKYIIYLTGFLALITNFAHRERWKQSAQVVLIVIGVLLQPSGIYTGLYLFVCIVLFFSKARHTVLDCIYLPTFILFLNPLQIMISISGRLLNLSDILRAASGSLMLSILTVESVRYTTRYVRDRYRGRRQDGYSAFSSYGDEDNMEKLA